MGLCESEAEQRRGWSIVVIICSNAPDLQRQQNCMSQHGFWLANFPWCMGLYKLTHGPLYVVLIQRSMAYVTHCGVAPHLYVDTGHLYVLYVVKYAIAISFIRRQNGTFLRRD